MNTETEFKEAFRAHKRMSEILTREGDYVLRIKFTDGSIGELDLRDILNQDKHSHRTMLASTKITGIRDGVLTWSNGEWGKDENGEGKFYNYAIDPVIAWMNTKFESK